MHNAHNICCINLETQRNSGSRTNMFLWNILENCSITKIQLFTIPKKSTVTHTWFLKLYDCILDFDMHMCVHLITVHVVQKRLHEDTMAHSQPVCLHTHFFTFRDVSHNFLYSLSCMCFLASA